MGLTRRDLLLAGLGLLVTGCAQDQDMVRLRPGPAWPTPPLSARPTTLSTALAAVPPPQAAPVVVSAAAPLGLKTIPRSRWASARPMPDRMQPLENVQQVTVHHEGWTPVWFTDEATTAARLDQIRRSHIERLRAGDIGYHLVIDRAGRIWEGRPLVYQGAHVKNHNPGNVGVMLLGNFDAQQPTEAQLGSLQLSLAAVMRHYKVTVRHVYTHQELNPTACPGRSLQPRVVAMRRGSALT